MDLSASALLNRLLARGKFRHIQVLLLLAELGSVQRTADAIGMTQSSVTQTLAALEELLDAKLFERHARGVRPTPVCNDLLPVARQLLRNVAEGADAILARRGEGRGLVRMISSTAAMHGLLVEALPEFVDRHPGIQVQLREAEGEDQLLAIARGDVDLVVCRRPEVIPEGWEFHAVREDRLAVVCRAQHPLAGQGSVKDEQLCAHPWLLIPAGFAARARFDEWAQSLAQPPIIYPVLSHSMSMAGWLLRQRDLLAFLPLQFARPLLRTGELVELAVGVHAPMRALGVLQPAKARSEAAGVFGTFLRGFSGGT